MFAAATVAVAGGAFSAPLVYDYKASVKHLNLKEVNVKFNNSSVRTYQKVVKSATLRGYLIVDADGATSSSAAGIQANVAGTPLWASGAVINPAQSLDHGRNRAFLVVQNNGVETTYRRPKVLPAIIEGKWIDTKFKFNGLARKASNDIAEAYLWVGGESVAPVRPKLDWLDGNTVDPVSRTPGVDPSVVPALATPGMVMVADYAWTSVYLFGKYNSPNWYFGYNTVAETAVDAGQPALFSIQTVTGNAAWFNNHPFFHDTWLNGAGFGKYVVLDEPCCGITDRPSVIDTLSGNLEGGLYLCTENGTDVNSAGYAFVGNGLDSWEEQFFTSRQWIATDYVGDLFQLDLWQDGNAELNTTDIIFGTWSIKRNASFFETRAVPMSNAEIALLTAGTGAIPAALFTENALGLADLTATIKGAILQLRPGTTIIRNRENWRMTKSNRTDVDPLTPNFALFYGLADWQ